MTDLITYVFEFTTMILSFIAAFLLYYKSRTSEVKIGARFLSLSIALLGLYALSTIIYSLIGQAWAIDVFMKIGIVSLIYAVLFLFYTMMILIYSSKWVRLKIVYMIGIFAIATIISVIIIVVNHIEVKNEVTADTHFNPILPFLLFALYMGFMLIFSTFALYYFGISKNSGDSKMRMIFFFLGLLLIILALINEVIGNFIEIEVLFDTILFGLLSGASILFALAFLRGNK
ncbi:MAG: hypothetical protein ACFFBP_20740 [Promethearchaeota archaeon]